MPPHVLNPFELLGVTPNSSCADVRKRYYALACLCHPDRGGTNEQMQTLHNAYQYVLRQVALNRECTYEDLEADFAQFCAQQTSTPPPFVDIHAEAFNLPRFNELFDGNREAVVDRAFEEGGYATVPSDVTLEYSPAMHDADELQNFETRVVVYTEPGTLHTPTLTVRDLTYPKLEDFSCLVGALHVSDYRVALSPPAPVKPDVPECTDVMKAFEQLQQRYAGIDMPEAMW